LPEWFDEIEALIPPLVETTLAEYRRVRCRGNVWMVLGEFQDWVWLGGLYIATWNFQTVYRKDVVFIDEPVKADEDNDE
jgi:hypothetical protein